MKALVTGGTGFIGSRVAARLADDGHFVRVFSRHDGLPERLREKKIELFRGNLEDRASVLRSMEGMDVMYHIGEIKNVTRAASEGNVALVKEVVERAGECGCKRVVFVSSITVAGIPAEDPATEDTQPAVVLDDHYTAYKRRCESLLAGMSGSEYVILRPAPVYGPGSRYLERLVDMIGKLGPLGFPFIGNGRNNAPLIYIEDVASAVYLAGTREGAAGETINLTDGLRHTWHEFLVAVATALGKRFRLIPVPPLLLKLSAMPVDLFSEVFGVELDPLHYIDFFTRNIFFDNAKARHLLSWQPGYSLESGAQEMVKTGKNNAKSP
jgi:nucleoside-diphosphate-sugar epimerase